MQDILSQYTLMVSFLGNTLSTSCEIYLLDARKKNLPIVAQCHAHPHTLPQLRKLVQQALRSPSVVENGILLNRGLFSTSGKLSKNSLYFIKDEAGKPIAVLCLVVRVQAYLEMMGYLESLIQLDASEFHELPPISPETLTYKAPTLEDIERMALDFSPEPQRLTPDEKTELLLDMYEADLFEMKGAVAKAAEVLQMSEQSIYRYLSKIRRYRE